MKTIDNRLHSQTPLTLNDLGSNECFRLENEHNGDVWLRSGGYEVDGSEGKVIYCIMIHDGNGSGLEGHHSLLDAREHVVRVPATLTLGEE